MAKYKVNDKQIKEQLHIENRRGDTWSGFRPVIMDNNKYNHKKNRAKAKAICKQYL